jgi:hypothetical protein
MNETKKDAEHRRREHCPVPGRWIWRVCVGPQKFVQNCLHFIATLATALLDPVTIVSDGHWMEETMAFWSKKEPEFDEVDRVIREKGGMRPADIARETGTERSTVSRRLASMEEAGYLYYEDDEGRLWPFDKNK